jgi:hypothetical protein
LISLFPDTSIRIPVVPLAPILAAAPLISLAKVLGVILRMQNGSGDSALTASWWFEAADDVHGFCLFAKNAVIELFLAKSAHMIILCVLTHFYMSDITQNRALFMVDW